MTFWKSNFRRFNNFVLRHPCLFIITVCLVIVILLFPLPKYKDSSILHLTAEDPSFLTIQCNPGRLGNQMSLYATLHGIASLNNRTPYVLHCNMEHLKPYFHLTTKNEIYELPDTEKRKYELSSYLRPNDCKIPRDRNFLDGYAFPNSYTFFHHIGKKIRNEFRFRDHISTYANHILSFYRSQTSQTVFVGIHVRRTDFCGWLNKVSGREVDMEYFIEAMDYFKEKYKDVLFFVVSDDRRWCKKQFTEFPDVIVVPKTPDPVYDLAILAQCDHTIMSYGSFGFWGAYLAGGETIYFANYLSPNSTFLKYEMPYNITYLPEWIGISTLKPGFWKRYGKNTHCKKPWYEIVTDWLWWE